MLVALVGCGTTAVEDEFDHSTVRIKFFTNDGNTINNARITLSGESLYSTVSTGNDAQIENIRFGTYQLRVNHDGYHTYERNGLPINRATMDIIVDLKSIAIEDSVRRIGFTVQNNTGEQINSIFVKPVTTVSWGTNLFTSVLANNSQTVVFLPESYVSHTGNFDLQIRDGSNNSYTKFNVSVLPNNTSSFTFTRDDLVSTDVSSQKQVTIQNVTGEVFLFGRIRENNAAEWFDLFKTTQPNGSTIAYLVPTELTSADNFDVQLWVSSAKFYTKVNVSIASDGLTLLTVTLADLNTETNDLRRIMVQNITSGTLFFGNIRGRSGTTTTAWVNLFSENLDNGSAVIYNRPHVLSAYETFDIQVFGEFADEEEEEEDETRNPEPKHAILTKTFTLSPIGVTVVTFTILDLTLDY
jgi:hypothetical protein